MFRKRPLVFVMFHSTTTKLVGNINIWRYWVNWNEQIQRNWSTIQRSKKKKKAEKKTDNIDYSTKSSVVTATATSKYNNNKDVNNADDDVWLSRHIFRRFNIISLFWLSFWEAAYMYARIQYSRETHTIFIVSSSAFFLSVSFLLIFFYVMSSSLIWVLIDEYLMLRTHTLLERVLCKIETQRVIQERNKNWLSSHWWEYVYGRFMKHMFRLFFLLAQMQPQKKKRNLIRHLLNWSTDTHLMCGHQYRMNVLRPQQKNSYRLIIIGHINCPISPITWKDPLAKTQIQIHEIIDQMSTFYNFP